MIGLDTAAIIDFFNDDKELKKLLDSIDEIFCSTIINYQEIVFGIDSLNEAHSEQSKFYDYLFDNLMTFVNDKISCKKSSEIYRHLRKKGEMIDNFDCMVAGIFLANGVNKVITRNKKHFEKIPGLKVISY